MLHDLKSIIIENPFFKEMEPRHLDLLVGCAKNIKLTQGQVIFKEGQAANEFYVLRSGKIALETFIPNRGSVNIMTLRPGEVLGWSWMIPPYKWHYDAKAVEESLAIVFDAACLRNKMEQDHDFGYRMCQRFIPMIVKRLQSTRLQCLDMYRSTQG